MHLGYAAKYDQMRRMIGDDMLSQYQRTYHFKLHGIRYTVMVRFVDFLRFRDTKRYYVPKDLFQAQHMLHVEKVDVGGGLVVMKLA